MNITSYQTQTFTSYVTAPPSAGGPSNTTSTDTEGISTSVPSSVSAVPSGSGPVYPSTTANDSIVSPSPSYVEVPVNTGHVIGAGKSSLAAIVVALAFAHFA
ncbi:hypothetical protein PtrM4_068770 [Pyrenophora tritici-repentis]|nr:hypothetical protein PtrM4_068770 [Pyrenophora tritici-repentis]